MRKVFSFLAIFLSLTCFARTQYFLDPQGTFTLTSNNYGPYQLTDLKIDSWDIYKKQDKEEVLYGKIEKIYSWTQTYTFKIEDELQSTHKAYLFSYGSLLHSLKEYEIRDNNGNVIGFIEGNYDTDSVAEFFFFNEYHELYAKVNVGQNKPHVTICSPDEKVLVSCTKVLRTKSNSYFDHDYQYYWIITEIEDDSFDSRFLWPFMAFISEFWWYSPPEKLSKWPI